MLLELAGIVVIAFLASLTACRAVITAGPRDVPTEPRKAHTTPTPTSGGIGVAIGFAAGLIALGLFSLAWRNEVSEQGVRLLWVTALFAYPLLAIGFIDDAAHLGPRLKFALYAVLSLGAAWTAGVVQDLPMGSVVLHLPYVVALLGTALWMFTLINVVNFMDGANGLSMGCVAIALFALAVIALERGSPAGAAATLCGFAALAGFLVWNFPAGRLFAGDSGALFAGAVSALASLIVIARTDLSPFVPPILFFPLLADALMTLLYRARRGRSLLTGHAEHVYQVAMAAGVRPIAPLYWAASAACAVAAYVVSKDGTNAAPFAALAVLAVAAAAGDTVVRRWAKSRGILA